MRTPSLAALLYLGGCSGPVRPDGPVDELERHDSNADCHLVDGTAADIQAAVASCDVVTLEGNFGVGTDNARNTVVLNRDGVQLVGHDFDYVAPEHGSLLVWNPSLPATLNGITVNINASDTRVVGLQFTGDRGVAIEVGDSNDGLSSDRACQNNEIVGNQFDGMLQSGGGAIIRIQPQREHSGNLIEGNYIRNWGNQDVTVAAIQVSNHRLVRDDGSGFGWNAFPAFEGTVIHANHFVGSTEFETHAEQNQSDVVQLYTPATVSNNYMSGSVNGISVKGDHALVFGNTLTNIFGDGALYQRDGNHNTFSDNYVHHNAAAGIWAWSGRNNAFVNNHFLQNGRAALLLGAQQNGFRPADHDPLQQADTTDLNAMQTSFQFTTDETLFLNNTFEDNVQGVYWFNVGSFPGPTAMFFVSNAFIGSGSLMESDGNRSMDGVPWMFNNRFDGFTDDAVPANTDTSTLPASASEIPAFPANWANPPAFPNRVGTNLVPPTPPTEAVPTNLGAVAGVDALTLQWDAPSGSFDVYNVFIDGIWTDWLPADRTSYTFTGLMPDTAYTLGVRTNTGDTVSAMATVQVSTQGEGTTPPGLPQAPLAFQVVPIPGGAELTWADPAEVGAINIFVDSSFVDWAPAGVEQYVLEGFGSGDSVVVGVRNNVGNEVSEMVEQTLVVP